MTTMGDTVVRSEPRTLSERISRFIGRTPVHIILVAIAVLWLVPTIGLFITSFRPASDMRATGWWTVLFEPRFTLDNYQQLLTDAGMGQAFLNSLFLTFMPIVMSAQGMSERQGAVVLSLYLAGQAAGTLPGGCRRNRRCRSGGYEAGAGTGEPRWKSLPGRQGAPRMGRMKRSAP